VAIVGLTKRSKRLVYRLLGGEGTARDHEGNGEDTKERGGFWEDENTKESRGLWVIERRRVVERVRDPKPRMQLNQNLNSRVTA
jgi:hypothetical protein